MKNVLLVISFISLFLLGLKAMDATFSPYEEKSQDSVLLVDGGGECLIQANPVGTIFPTDSYFPYGDKAVTGAQSLARQLRLCGKIQRVVSLHYSLLFKELAWRVSQIRMNILSRSFFHTYSSFPHLSWKLSSEHYVFGMRRILI